MNKKTQVIKERLLQEIKVAVGNHFEVYINSGFVQDVEKSVDDAIEEILKISHNPLMKH